MMGLPYWPNSSCDESALLLRTGSGRQQIPDATAVVGSSENRIQNKGEKHEARRHRCWRHGVRYLNWHVHHLWVNVEVAALTDLCRHARYVGCAGTAAAGERRPQNPRR